jgi:hypothetical protein
MKNIESGPKKMTPVEMDRLYEEKVAEQTIKKSRELQPGLDKTEAEELTRLERLINLEDSGERVNVSEEERQRYNELKAKIEKEKE